MSNRALHNFHFLSLLYGVAHSILRTVLWSRSHEWEAEAQRGETSSLWPPHPITGRWGVTPSSLAAGWGPTSLLLSPHTQRWESTGNQSTQRGSTVGDVHMVQTMENSDVNLTNLEHRQRDFPGGLVGKTSCSQCRGPGLNSWSGH